jgi:hypothetical protein
VVNRKDLLFQALVDGPAAQPSTDEALVWHLLTVDDGSAPAVMSWLEYASLVARLAAPQPAGSRAKALAELASALQNPKLVETFAENRIDIRRVLALLAGHSSDPAAGFDLPDSLMPLTVFHLQAASPELKDRAAGLLRSGLQQPDVNKHLQPLPDNVLSYLRDNLCRGESALAAPGRWIDAELARRKNAYRLEAASRAASPLRSLARPPSDAASPPPAAAVAPTAIPLASSAPARTRLDATPAPPPPTAGPAAGAANSKLVPAPLLGQIALPTPATKKADGALWLWIAIVIIGVLAVAVIIGALIYVQSFS